VAANPLRAWVRRSIKYVASDYVHTFARFSVTAGDSKHVGRVLARGLSHLWRFDMATVRTPDVLPQSQASTPILAEPMVVEIPQPIATRVPIAEEPIASEAIADSEIAEVAFGLFEARGCEHGHDVEDWLAAEALIKERRR